MKCTGIPVRKHLHSDCAQAILQLDWSQSDHLAQVDLVCTYVQENVHMIKLFLDSD